MADTANRSDDPSVPGAAYEIMAERWELPQTLMMGTQGMRMAGTKYLPQEPKESQAAYENRRDRTTLFNQFKAAVDQMTGKVFRKEIVLNDDVPDQIQEWAVNIDLNGRDLSTFARDVFEDGGVSGLSYILVDRQPGTPGATLADERARNERPYFKHIKAKNLIGWRSDSINGVPTLTQIRIRESSTEDEGRFGEKHVERIRVIELVRTTDEAGNPASQVQFELFKQNESGDWDSEQTGIMTIDRIPLAVYYAERLDFMFAAPPYEDLAEKNAEHWQSGSDQRHILHVARVPILFGTGLKDQQEVGTQRPVGPTVMWSETLGATLEYVEHSGKGIEAGREDLKDIEEQMRILAAMPLLPRKSGNVSRDETQLAVAQTNSPLQEQTISLGNCLELALDFMAQWHGLDDGGTVKVNQDFGITFRDAQDLQRLTELRNARDLSRETLWKEYKRRGVLEDDFKADEELLRLEEEGDNPPLGTIGEPGTLPPPEPEPGPEDVAA